MLRPPSPPAPRGRPVQAHLRAGVGRIVVLAALGAAALPAAITPSSAIPDPPRSLDPLVGQVLYVLHDTTVRTRGGGNVSVDLPRGRSVVLVSAGGGRAVLQEGPSEAALLLAHGVRKPPRYTATAAQVASDLVPAADWEKARADGARRIAARWPDLPPSQAERIFLGQPFLGMTLDQAEEALGTVVLARTPAAGGDGTVTWTVGRRPRSAELRAYNEARERGPRPRTFEEYVAGRARAVLTFRDGRLTAIDPPAGDVAGQHWP